MQLKVCPARWCTFIADYKTTCCMKVVSLCCSSIAIRASDDIHIAKAHTMSIVIAMILGGCCITVCMAAMLQPP